MITRLVWLTALTWSLCVSPAVAQQHQPADLPTLDGQFATSPDLEPLVADLGFIDDRDFYVRFSRGGRSYYSGGNWADRIEVLPRVESAQFQGPYLLPLQYERSVPWSSLPGDAQPIRILDSEDWYALRERLFAAILTREEKRGVVLHFNVDDYFLYYSESGQFQADVIDTKPGDYEVARRIAMTDLVGVGLPLLEAFLKERDITDRRVAFNTGDSGYYALPFVYINRDLPVVAFIRLPGPRIEFRSGPGATPYVQTAGHVAGSHTAGIVVRPFSSIYRLLFVTTDTVTEAITPSVLTQPRRMPPPPLATGSGMDIEEWEIRLDRLTGREASRGTIRYLVDGEAFFTRFIDAVTRAEKSITLRTYIFDNDDYAVRIAELLKKRSNEGVDVKVLLDGLGTIVSTIEKQPTLPSDYRGPASVRRFLESDSEVNVRQASNPWMTGDHVKTAVIDGRLAFTGGMNIAREYRYDWHDLMVELEGPIVNVLQYEFEKAWAHAGILGDFGYAFRRWTPMPDDADIKGYPLRALFTRADDYEIFKVQREAVRNARHHIYVQNAYFTDDAMLYELARARQRGVDVRVIVPLVTDRGAITRNNALAANAMLEHGIRVFIYPGMSHVKAAIFDGWACIGSANWDRWSFRINKELNVATSHPKAVRELREQLFEADFEKSVELLEPFPERWSDYLIEMIGDYVF